MGSTPFHLEQHPIAISSSAEVPVGADIAFTIKALGDWSSKVVDSVKAGTRVWVDGPMESSPLIASKGRDMGFQYFSTLSSCFWGAFGLVTMAK